MPHVDAAGTAAGAAAGVEPIKGLLNALDAVKSRVPNAVQEVALRESKRYAKNLVISKLTFIGVIGVVVVVGAVAVIRQLSSKPTLPTSDQATAQSVAPSVSKVGPPTTAPGNTATMLAGARACLQQVDIECARGNVERILSADPRNMEARKLLPDITNAENKNNAKLSLEIARGCIAAKDLECALQRANEALKLEPGNPTAIALLRDIDNRTKQTVIAEKLYAAEQCLTSGDLVCATAAADDVLQLEPQNITAVGMKRRMATAAQTLAQGPASALPPVPNATSPITPAAAPPVPMAQDATTGCYVWKPILTPNDTVMWSGGCASGFAQGPGTAQWTANGKPTLTYEGTFQSGFLQGRGKMIATGGDRYDGDYRDGKRDGRGVYVAATGDRYDGEWRNNKRHGYGVLISANGNRFEGVFKDGKSISEATQ